jgi:DNA-directed RNA polymerase specialized sigma subunit
MRVPHAALTTSPASDWGQQTRGVLTRDLLVRASQVAHGEGRALQFRVLHLNLALVAEAAGRLGLAAPLSPDTEHVALEGLLDAVRSYDPWGEPEFATFAAPLIERRIQDGNRPDPRVFEHQPHPTRR